MADVKWSQFPNASPLSLSDIWVGLQSGNNVQGTFSLVNTLLGSTIQISESQVTNLVSDLASKLNLSGGTMTGNLILNGSPTTNLQAVDKQYVDSGFAPINFTLQQAYNNSSSPQITGAINFYDGTANTFSIFGSNPHSIYQMISTTRGTMPLTLLSTSQESTLVSSLSSGDNGLFWYNNTINIANYWNGSQQQQLLSIQNLNAGSNVTLDKSVPGQVTVNASGGGTAPTAAYASWSIQNNPITTSISTSFIPIAVPPDGSGFFNVATSDFTNQIIGPPTLALSTIVSTYNAANTQFFIVSATVSARNPSGSTSSCIFDIGILKANSTIVSTPFWEQIDILGSPPSQNLSATVVGIVELSTGDSVFLQVKNPSTSSSVVVTFIDFYVSNISGSIPNTNSLLQGTQNIYLSQNGGTTYQFLSGTATVGDLAQFNSTGGQLIDSGISASSIIKNVLVTGTTQQIAMNTNYIVKSSSTVTFTLPPTNSSIGIFEITGTGSANWIVNENTGQFVLYNGISSTTSTGTVSSSTAYDYAKFVYAGDASGQFNIAISDGNQINLT